MAVLLVIALLFVTTKLVGLGRDDPRFEGLVDQQRRREEEPQALRGSFVDRGGATLVMSVPTKVVGLDPSAIKDSEQVARSLAPLLNMGVAEIMEKAERPDSQYVLLARDVELAVIDQIEEAGIEGVTTNKDAERVAVAGTGRTVLGRVDDYSDTITGLEKQYNEVLGSQDGKMTYERTTDGRTIPGSETIEANPQDGGTVYLTLDHSMQYVTETMLNEQVRLLGAKGGSVIVGRPATGEILAMASSVRLDDGDVVTGSLNQSVRTYEPGSIMKVVTTAAAFDSGIMEPGQSIDVPYRVTRYAGTQWEQSVADSHHHPTQSMTMNDILAESSNVGTILVAEKLGKERILNYLDLCGFGQKTALDFPNELAGQVPHAWNGTDIMSIPIGQTMTATPLQVWGCYNAVANDGIYVPPKLVDHILEPNGETTVPSAPEPHTVMSPQAAQLTNEALQQVVERGTANKIAIDGYKIAGKTGTAFKVLDNGRYGDTEAERKYFASFVGFLPADDPQISIIVQIDEPQPPATGGAEAAAPLFQSLAKEALRRYAIAADKPSALDGGPIRSEPAVVPSVPYGPIDKSNQTVGRISGLWGGLR